MKEMTMTILNPDFPLHMINLVTDVLEEIRQDQRKQDDIYRKSIKTSKQLNRRWLFLKIAYKLKRKLDD